MKLKYIIALLIFFGNLIAIYINNLSQQMSQSIMISERQRTLLRLNQTLLFLLIVLMLCYLYMIVRWR